MPHPALPAAVLEAWNLTGIGIRQIEGGFSGAEIYHCQHRDGAETVLRCWPIGTAAGRIAEVQRVVREARRQGCVVVPQIFDSRSQDAVVTAAGRHWEHSQWMPGAPCQPSDDKPQQLEAFVQLAAAAVGQFHVAVRHLGTRTECPAAVVQRCERLVAAERWFQQRPLATAGSRWPLWVIRADAVLRAAWPLHHKRLQTALTAALSQPSDVQYVLRDCHHAHLLFNAAGTQVSGLIDFDALRIDTPATDLARLVHSFAALSRPQGGIVGGGPWDASIQSWRTWVQEDLWRAAVAGIRQHCSFTDQQWELARLLADSTTLLSLVNWTVWATGDGSTHPADQSSGADSIQNRVEQLSHFAINYLT